MKRLTVEVQQARAPEGSPDYRSLLRDITCIRGGRECFIDNQTSDFLTPKMTDAQLQEMWKQIQEAMKQDENLGKVMIVASEGDHGWDDYLLLHHFDPDEPLDIMLEVANELTEAAENEENTNA